LPTRIKEIKLVISTTTPLISQAKRKTFVYGSCYTYKPFLVAIEAFWLKDFNGLNSSNA